MSAKGRTPVVFMSDLRRSYDSASGPVFVLKGIDFIVARGEYVAIVGPSGSGKSTLLSCLGCLDKPTGGVYQLDGVDVLALDDDETAHIRNQRIGFVFQAYNLLPRLRAIENVALPLFYAGVGTAEAHGRARKALAELGLGDRGDAYPEQLSGGQRQRVAIARALVSSPSLILADEPTGALDTTTASEIIETFERINRQGTTLIMVTHDRELAARANRRVAIVDGVITTDEEKGAPQGPH